MDQLEDNWAMMVTPPLELLEDDIKAVSTSKKNDL